MASAVRPTNTQSWWYRNGVIVGALVIVVVGTVVFMLAPTAVPLYGWTAYTPLSSSPDFADYARKSYLTEQHLVGAESTCSVSSCWPGRSVFGWAHADGLPDTRLCAGTEPP